MSDLALLTPVPLEHLADGVEVCRRAGTVAFGSNAWELFDPATFPLDPGDDVLIYSSHAGEPTRLVVSWRARFVRYRRFEDIPRAELRKIRPPSTRPEDRASPWSGFYEVRDLSELPAEEVIPIGDLQDKRGNRYRDAFHPEGPIVVTAP